MSGQGPAFEGIERQPLRTFTEKAYLEYSMYVILDRALPAIGDGLKPKLGAVGLSITWRGTIIVDWKRELS
jgi:hypothetical protein